MLSYLKYKASNFLSIQNSWKHFSLSLLISFGLNIKKNEWWLCAWKKDGQKWYRRKKKIVSRNLIIYRMTVRACFTVENASYSFIMQWHRQRSVFYYVRSEWNKKRGRLKDSFVRNISSLLLFFLFFLIHFFKKKLINKSEILRWQMTKISG